LAKHPVFLNNLPLHNPSFVGRDAYINKIHELIKDDQNILVVSGIAGTGKTSIIREFCARYTSEFGHLIWISARNGILENLSRDKNIRANLFVEENLQNTSEIAQRIVNKLNAIEGNNLLVLDDVEEEFSKLRQILPLKSNWRIIASSRFDFQEFASLSIGELAGKEALELFYKHYQLQQNDELLLNLFKPLGFHALTIELFAKTAQFHKLPLKDLMKRVKSLSFDFGKRTSISTDHSDVFIEDLGKYYEKIFPVKKNSKEEINILRQFAILPSTFSEINDLFKLFSIRLKSEDVFSYNLNRLVQKGWIDNLGTSYKLNLLIKKFIKFKYPTDYKFYEPQIKTLRKLLSVDTVKESPVGTFKWLPFGQEVLNNFKLEDVETVTLANNLALRYRDNGNFGAARDILEQVLDYDIKTYGEDSNLVELSRANLGNIYSDLGDYQKAGELLERSLQASLRNYPKNHPKISVRQSNLGLIYRDLGKLDKAVELLEASLESDLLNYPKDSPTVAVRQSNLALVYKDLGEYKGARDLLEESIATTIKHDGKTHPRVALRRSNLALVYKAMGEYRKAIDLLETALESDKENFGDNHPKIAVRLMNLAIIYLEINELQFAKDRITLSLNIALYTLGAEHPDTLSIKKMYDKIYRLF